MYSLDYAYTFAYQNGTPRNKISYLLSIYDTEIPYVFIGSSRVDNTIDASIVEKSTNKKAINLGIQGSNTDDYLLMLKLLKKQKIKTEYVFIQIDYVYNMEGKSDILKAYLMPYINDTDVSEFLQERSSNFFSLKYIPFYRYLQYDYLIGFREFFSTTIGKKNKIDLENGYFPKYGYSGVPLQANLPSSLVSSNDNITAINNFAKDNDIRIIYFIAPYCPETKNIDFADKLQKRLPYFYNFVSIFNKEPENFYDCGHLNNDGAQEFSKIFAERIISQNSKYSLD